MVDGRTGRAAVSSRACAPVLAPAATDPGRLRGAARAPDATVHVLRELRAVGIDALFAEWYGRRTDPLIPAAHARWTWQPSLPLRPWSGARGDAHALRISQHAVNAAHLPWPARIEALRQLAALQPGPRSAMGAPASSTTDATLFEALEKKVSSVMRRAPPRYHRRLPRLPWNGFVATAPGVAGCSEETRSGLSASRSRGPPSRAGPSDTSSMALVSSSTVLDLIKKTTGES